MNKAASDLQGVRKAKPVNQYSVSQNFRRTHGAMKNDDVSDLEKVPASEVHIAV